MGIPLKDFTARFTEEEWAQIEARAREIIAAEMELRALRTPRGQIRQVVRLARSWLAQLLRRGEGP